MLFADLQYAFLPTTNSRDCVRRAIIVYKNTTDDGLSDGQKSPTPCFFNSIADRDPSETPQRLIYHVPAAAAGHHRDIRRKIFPSVLLLDWLWPLRLKHGTILPHTPWLHVLRGSFDDLLLGRHLADLLHEVADR